MQNGLPYFLQQAQYSTSNLGRATDIAKANLNAKLAGSGSALPSGFATSADANLEEGGAEAQEQNILQLLAQQTAQKNLGAASLAELGTTGAGIAGGANSAVMNAPLQNNFWSNLIAGIVQGASRPPVPAPTG